MKFKTFKSTNDPNFNHSYKKWYKEKLFYGGDYKEQTLRG